MLETYSENYSDYVAYCSKLHRLIEEVLAERRIRVHSVMSRVKARESLTQKIWDSKKLYRSLSQVTDIIGLRIVTYFADDVDRVAACLEEEFDVDKNNSIDKRSILDADRFGYLSLHYVVSLSASRKGLTEYKRFPVMKAEIQIRSILQHAWAEIEHDLGYKTSLELPAGVKRRFFRLAGLLELADQEFMTVRDSINSYEDAVRAKMVDSPQFLKLDAVTLRAYMGTSELLKEVDHGISEVVGLPISSASRSLHTDIASLFALGVKSIRDLEEVLSSRKDVVIKFAKLWASEKSRINLSGSFFPSGISLFFLVSVMSAESDDEEFVAKILSIWSNGAEGEMWACDTMRIYSQALGQFK